MIDDGPVAQRDFGDGVRKIYTACSEITLDDRGLTRLAGNNQRARADQETPVAGLGDVDDLDRLLKNLAVGK